QSAVAASNANVGAGYLTQGPVAMNVRGVGLLGRGQDPMQRALALTGPLLASRRLRSEERLRVRELRDVVVTTVNNVPIRVEDLVTGGPGTSGEGTEGVFVGHQPRLGLVGISRPKLDARGEMERDAAGKVLWDDEPDMIQGIVLMRKGEATLPALQKLKVKV